MITGIFDALFRGLVLVALYNLLFPEFDGLLLDVVVPIILGVIGGLSARNE